MSIRMIQAMGLIAACVVGHASGEDRGPSANRSALTALREAKKLQQKD